METEKSTHLHIQAGDQQAGGTIQSGSKATESRKRSLWCKSKSGSRMFRTRSSDAWGRMRMSLAQAERVNLPLFALLFYSGPQWIGWFLLHCWGWSSFAPSLIQMLISSSNTLANTPRNNALSTIWTSFSFIKLTYKINHHITSMRKVNKWMKLVMGMSEGKGINIFSVRWPACAQLDKCQGISSNMEVIYVHI